MANYGEGPYGAGQYGIGAALRKLAAIIRLPVGTVIVRQPPKTIVPLRRAGRRR